MNLSKTRTLAYCALLIAMSALLGGGLSIKSFVLGGYSLKIGFGVLPVLLAGIWFGPLWGGAVGALADLTQALLFPLGPYMPWFSISGALFGVIPGLFFLKKPAVKPLWTLVCVAATMIISSVFVNTAIQVVFLGRPWEIIYARAITQAVMIPIHTALVYAIERATRFIRIKAK